MEYNFSCVGKLCTSFFKICHSYYHSKLVTSVIEGYSIAQTMKLILKVNYDGVIRSTEFLDFVPHPVF
jgi:hypothetical protein